MPTSHATNIEIKKILNKYLNDEEQVKMFCELIEVKGNDSFKKSMKAMLMLIHGQRLQGNVSKIK